MMKYIILSIFFVLGFYNDGVQADFCSDFEDQGEDVLSLLGECCQGLMPSDLSKYESCENDDKCAQVTCYMEVDKVMIDGTVNNTAAQQLALGKKADKIWTAIVKRGYKLCVNLADSADCPAFVLAVCLRGMAFAQCPQSMLTNSNSCTDLKQYIKKCQLRLF